MQQLQFELPELDRKATQRAVEDALEKYRVCKYLVFEEREASTTAGYVERFHGPTNVTSDSTASIAIHNVDAQAAQKAYCERMERQVKRLPVNEQKVIRLRYMEDDYVLDYQVQMELGISVNTYNKRRWKAFYKLALALDIAVQKSNDEAGAT
ncbi:phage transcriptional regulator, ArpU family [Cohnella sp. OV330]|uniref:ArpU family phage packaging/lysis transcriptional regulator n=1 Tax=Cohnella sp. OV330 TaxID=1855288 RepID=UPI0008E9963E|nr:ArpU family phage packaging/lysis transcriptional regulator [Cohnella sp. OV330]SFA90742.1 phage transcriptional regulator, ArpU family [Cohnella sp. OV330]